VFRKPADAKVLAEHVHVNEGGQAVIGNVRTRDENREPARPKIDQDIPDVG
jgi:hypothetical protein